MTAPARPYRLTSIDFLRGLVMVIMALDHVRDFFTSARFDPLDLEQTDTALFLTRWITHFCAPVFVILAGISAGLMQERRTTAELSKFLLSRGLWLIFIEITLVSFGWNFVILTGYAVALQVIWAIGLSMIVMAGLVWLPRPVMLFFGLLLVFGHNMLDYGLFPAQSWATPQPFWHALHNQGYTLLGPLPVAFAYPVLPWIGIMPLGFCLARLYQEEVESRRRALVQIGLASLGAFIALRALNLYGDPDPWASQSSLGHTLLSFLNVQKYPPSLMYLLLTGGAGLLVLALAEKWRGRFVDWMVTFGRVPFFYYILHIYLAHLLAMAAAEWQGFGARSVATFFFQYPEGYGFGLPVVYAVWLLVLIILYPACKWFAALKARRRDWWLSYL